ncbi:MAG: ATP-binding cassette domain-containing protein [Candidatus Eisenbacteria bacterium]|nr:ATP-binding cassette domain-containing protein [Candidatus Latescibacterota bacterium]MBD3301695.1 ATP-binding cassette domain-containing protein [Candidatus Eisenbacteria bacterium]
MRRLASFLLPNLSVLGPALRRHRRRYLVGYLCLLATNGFSLAIPMVLRAGVNRLETGGTTPMIVYGAWLVGLAAVSGLFRYFMRMILIGASRRIEYELRNDFLGHLQRLSLSFFHRQKTGDLMARATNDLNAVRDVVGPGIMYGMNTVTIVTASLILMLRIDPWLTLFTLLPLPLLAFAVRRFASEMHHRSRAVQDQFGRLSSTIQENLAGIRVVQSYVQEPFEERSFEEEARTYRSLGYRLIRYRALFFATMGSLVGLLMLILLWAGGMRVIGDQIGLGDFVAFLGYLGMLTWPFIALGWVLSLVQRGEAAMARMREIRERTPEIRSPDRPQGDPPLCEGRIRFEDVRFRYGPDGPEVLRGIDETIEPGTTVAIVGRTGSGKSTLVSLVPRLFDPTGGAISIDGVDVRRRSLEELRRAVAVVPQDSFLFSDTLRANLVFGAPDAGEERIAEALRISRLEKDLATFPEGLETRIGERGITLSGGQRQRVALARALLADPRILILDDAFSNLDKITEAECTEALGSVRAQRTILLIAHRISTVRDADRILVLQKGIVAESGTHQELLEAAGIYSGMEREQRLAEEIERASVS